MFISLVLQSVAFVSIYGNEIGQLGVSLDSKFDSFILYEFIEIINHLKPNSFYSYISELVQYEDLDLLTENQLSEKALQTAMKFVDETDAELIQLMMSTRFFSPLVHSKISVYNSTFNQMQSSGVSDCEKELIHFNNKVYCDIKKFTTEYDSIASSSSSALKNENYHQDINEKVDNIHKNKIANKNSRIAFLYGCILSKDFKESFEKLLQLSATTTEFVFVFRYKTCFNYQDNKNIYLSGYGAALSIKNLEYLNVDDRILTEDEDYEDDKENNETNSNPGNNSDDKLHELYNQDDTTIKLNMTNNLGARIAQFTLSTKKPLKTLSYIVQNLPKLKYYLSKKKIKKSGCLKFGQTVSWFDVSYPKQLVTINGIKLEIEYHNIFSIIEILDIFKKNTNLLKNELKISTQKALNILIKTSDLINSENDISSLTFDFSDNIEFQNKNNLELKSIIVYLNNLKKDKRYRSWSNKIETILQPTSYSSGFLKKIRKNYITVILCLDLLKPNNFKILIEDVLEYIEALIPIRFGIVPLIDENNKDSIDIAALFVNIYSSFGITKLTKALDLIYGNIIKGDNVVQAFKKTCKNIKDKTKCEPSSDTKKLIIEKLSAYKKRLNLNEDTFFVNGKRESLTKNFNNILVKKVQTEVENIKQLVKDKKVKQETNIREYFTNNENTFKRYNPLIFDKINTKFIIHKNLDFHFFNYKETPQLTFLIVIDLHYPKNLKIIENILQFISNDKNTNSRISIMNRNTKTNSISNLIYQLLTNNKKNYNYTRIYELISGYKNDPKFIQDLGEISIEINTEDEQEEKYWKSKHEELNNETEILKANNQFLIVNGKLICFDDYAIELEHVFDMESFVASELNSRINKIDEKIKDKLQVLATTEADQFIYSDKLMLISSVISKNSYDLLSVPNILNRNFELPEYKSPECHYEPKSNNEKDSSWGQVRFLIDPVSETAQKWVPLLNVLDSIDGLDVQGYISPATDENSVVFNQFYSYVLQSKMGFDQYGKTITPKVFFKVSNKPVYTFGIDAVPKWITSAFRGNHDLDNVNFKNQKTIEAVYELNSIVVDGYSHNSVEMEPTKGLQLSLFNYNKNSSTRILDTIVMENLGYFQFQAEPGLYTFSIRPETRSQEIFYIDSFTISNKKKTLKHGNNANRSSTEMIYNNNEFEIFTSKFTGAEIYINANKYKNKQNEHLLIDQNSKEKKDGGYWDSFKQKIYGDNSSNLNETINVFTVASGHLYERLASIMMLSVIRNTNNKVKFWFIESFLSPSFKKFIPIMAEKYGYEYEFVNYRWPPWLNHQTEKQRIIWGYKILFLDVLFPLDIKKIIFVDADQIVRADLLELYNIDLKGRPYGYVPFCNSRKNMDNYRFWEQGYWKDYLNGKPYHISALYVIDLERFRALGAGDMLRGHYQMLSQDKNSLANLDQDLPNHLQHQLPIYSLPKEWLWCETWCDDKSLKNAKTIDLCNNPKTKESKLHRAKRIVDEWSVYDDELKPIRDNIFVNLKNKQKSKTKFSENIENETTYESEKNEKDKKLYDEEDDDDEL